MKCATCPGDLYPVDVLANATTCITCENKRLNAQIARDIAEANRLKVRGQAQASAARPDDRQKVERAIRQLAATGRPFSANDARKIHGCKGGVVGAAFGSMIAAKVIRSVGEEISTDPGTHSKKVGRWIGTQAVAA